jgi:hypothetical protein
MSLAEKADADTANGLIMDEAGRIASTSPSWPAKTGGKIEFLLKAKKRSDEPNLACLRFTRR